MGSARVLPAVLAAITERPVGHWRAELASPAWRGLSQIDATTRRPPRVRWKVEVEVDFARKTTRERSALLTVESPEAAVEVLSERGLWPWAPGDTGAPWWWCEFLNDSEIDTPPSLAALVAVASLGVATLRRVAELVRELHAVTGSRCEACGGRGGCVITTGDGSHGTLEQESCDACDGTGRVSPVGATLVWRVMAREALGQWHDGVEQRPGAHPFTTIFSRESNAEPIHRDRWPKKCPYYGWFGDPGNDFRGTHRAWPILRALAVHEDETPTGLHLVAADRERVVIAVEAL